MGLINPFRKPPSEDRFAQRLLKALRAAGDPREARYLPEKFQIRFSEQGRDAGVANLRNFYNEHCLLPPGERKKHLKHIARGLLTYLKKIPADFQDVSPDLRPIVRTRSYFEFLQLQSEIEGHDPPRIPHHDVGDHLIAALVYDLPESMQSVNQEQLEEWDVSYYESLEIARRNLEETDFALASIGSRVYISVTGDNYDASRLLLTDLIGDLDVSGQPVAIVPNRDTLIITGSEDDQGLALMADFAEDALAAPRPMSAIPMVLKEGEWQGWRPASDHPLFHRFHSLEVKSLASEYAEQKGLLETLFRQRKLDRSVASYSAVEQENHGSFSFCLWSQGVETFLPVTQKIIFYQEGSQQLWGGEWDHVLQVVGELMQPVDLYPLRYHVQEFPSPSQLDEIGPLSF